MEPDSEVPAGPVEFDEALEQFRNDFGDDVEFDQQWAEQYGVADDIDDPIVEWGDEQILESQEMAAASEEVDVSVQDMVQQLMDMYGEEKYDPFDDEELMDEDGFPIDAFDDLTPEEAAELRDEMIRERELIPDEPVDSGEIVIPEDQFVEPWYGIEEDGLADNMAMVELGAEEGAVISSEILGMGAMGIGLAIGFGVVLASMIRDNNNRDEAIQNIDDLDQEYDRELRELLQLLLDAEDVVLLPKQQFSYRIGGLVLGSNITVISRRETSSVSTYRNIYSGVQTPNLKVELPS
jgi:hypothetical protein